MFRGEHIIVTTIIFFALNKITLALGLVEGAISPSLHLLVSTRGVGFSSITGNFRCWPVEIEVSCE